MELHKYILSEGLKIGMCKPGAEEISTGKNAKELMEMYVKSIDFCLDNNFPCNNDLVQLGGNIINEYGVYVDSEISAHNDKFLVLLGSCIGSAEFDNFSASQVFVKHNSKVNIKAEGNSFIVIDSFDNSFLNIEATGNAKVRVNVYGSSKVAENKSGNAIIKTILKSKNTY